MNKFWKIVLEVILDKKFPENAAEGVQTESSAAQVSPPETLSNAGKTDEKSIRKVVKPMVKAHEMLIQVQSVANKEGKIIVEVKEVGPGVFGYSVSHEAPQQEETVPQV